MPAARCPTLLLIIAGEGPALASLKQLAHDLGMGGTRLFVGYLDRRTTLLDCYAAGDAFVFASRTETQGLVLLEAMALGVPVVSTAVLGTRDLLSAGKGALVATEDLDDFAAQIVRLLRDPALRSRLSAEGRALAQEWSAERLAARMLEFYRETVERAQQPTARKRDRAEPPGSAHRNRVQLLERLHRQRPVAQRRDALGGGERAGERRDAGHVVAQRGAADVGVVLARVAPPPGC